MLSQRQCFVVVACVTISAVLFFSSVGQNWTLTPSNVLLAVKVAIEKHTETTNVSNSPGKRYKPGARPFNVSETLLTSMGLPPSKFSDLSPEALKQFVVAFGSSKNHFTESLDAVASVQKNLPGRPIFYYDLGLTDSQIQEIKSWCSVHYRKFNFTKYPNFVKNLHRYAWKPLIVQEILRDHTGVLWMDASFRWLSPNLTVLYEKAIASDGFLVFGKTGHSNFAVTNGGMFKYLASDSEDQKRTEQYGATCLFVVNTLSNYNHVLRWYYLCALTKTCISPGGGIACRFKHGDRYKVYAGCHRFDQSLANVLLANRWGYNVTYYTVDDSLKLFKILRHPTKLYELAVCKGSTVKRV